MDAFLLRMIPELAGEWGGATEEEIEAIERVAGRPLPDFYRWFLARMGANMGSLSYVTLDFSAPTVLQCHAQGLAVAEPKYLLIARESDELMPMHVFYDLDRTARGDALVTIADVRTGERHDEYETFREMIAWAALYRSRVKESPQTCQGSLLDNNGDVLARLDPVMRRLGMVSPVPTGPYCGLFEGHRESMVTTAPLGDTPDIHAFRLGGDSASQLRRILGEITTVAGLELNIDEWDPPLPD